MQSEEMGMKRKEKTSACSAEMDPCPWAQGADDTWAKLPPQATHGISAGHHRGCQPVAKPFGNRDRSCLGSSELVKREKADLNTGDHFFLFLGTIESKRLWAICSLREDAKLLEPCELHRVFRALCPPHWYRAAYRPHSALCMSRGCWTLQVFGMLGHFIFFILT